MSDEKRIGFVGIIIDNPKRLCTEVNEILSMFGELILARTGLPYRAKGISVITLVVEATTDEVGALTGRLGALEGVSVKSGMSR